MRRFALFPVLLVIAVVLGACENVAGPGSRTLDGEWSARVDGETVWFSLREDRGSIRGSGDWGRDGVYVRGDRYGDDVRLVFEFNYDYHPIELEGRVSSQEIDGRLYGSGFEGERVRFRRGSRR